MVHPKIIEDLVLFDIPKQGNVTTLQFMLKCYDIHGEGIPSRQPLTKYKHFGLTIWSIIHR